MDDPLLGKTLDKCRILQRIGAGGMGTVYLAEHFALNRKIAVKVLDPSKGMDADFVERFRREATTAAKLQHPNIAQIYDVGFAEGRYFIMMQLVEGGSLQWLLEQKGPLPPPEAAKIAIGILSGLQHAHEAGVIHRDIKPENVLLGKDLQPRIVDFGLAVETEGQLRLTAEGTVMGTPYYLSPEQARGRRADPRSDLYSLGVTLYYILTGRRPFQGSSPLAILNKHVHETPISPATINPAIPKELNDIVLKLMAKKPAERYTSAAAAIRDLENFLAGRTVAAAKPVTTRAVRRSSPVPWIAAAAGAAAVVVVLVLALGRSPDRPAPQPQPGPDKKTEMTDWEKDMRKKLVAIGDEARKLADDYAACPDILARYRKWIVEASGTELEKVGEKALAEWQGGVEDRARAEAKPLRAKAEELRRASKHDAALAELRRFPRPLLPITETGKQIEQEIRDLQKAREEHAAKLRQEANHYIDTERFEAAEERIQALGNPPDLVSRLEARRKTYDEKRTKELLTEYSLHRRGVSDQLRRRVPRAAIETLQKFLADREADARILKVSGVDYARPDRASISRALAAASATLSSWILLDLDHALAIEDALRRAREKMTVGQVTLFGLQGYVTREGADWIFVSGTEKRKVDLPTLHPRDLCSLSGPEPAVWLFSDVPDRRNAALRIWRAAGAPDFFLEGLEREAAEERTKLMDAALADVRRKAAAKDWAGARAALDAAAKGAQDTWETLQGDFDRAGAELALMEARAAYDAKEYGKARDLLKKLKGRDAAVLELYQRALYRSGSWPKLPNDLEGDAWGWDGKAQRQPAPAKEEGASLRLDARRRLLVNPAKSKGCTGMAGSCRLNEAIASWQFGFVFDITDKDTQYKYVRIGSDGFVALHAFNLGTWTLVDRRRLETKIDVGTWVEFGFVADEGEVIAYVDGAPVLVMKAILPDEHAMGLFADADVTYKDLRIRR